MTMVDYHWIYDQFNANGTFLGHWIKLFISFGGSSIDLNIDWTSNKNVHSVWKSHKKSHSTLRAKRATFTFWVDKSSLKLSKMGNLAKRLLVSFSVFQRLLAFFSVFLCLFASYCVFQRLSASFNVKMSYLWPRFEILWNETFRVILKHCAQSLVFSRIWISQ